MGAAAGIPGLTKGPDFESDKNESGHIESIQKDIKLNRVSQVNDPALASAVEKLEQSSSISERKVEIEYDAERGLVVFTIYSPDGENKIWQIPRDEAIKMASKMSSQNSQYVNAVM